MSINELNAFFEFVLLGSCLLLGASSIKSNKMNSLILGAAFLVGSAALLGALNYLMEGNHLMPELTRSPISDSKIKLAKLHSIMANWASYSAYCLLGVGLLIKSRSQQMLLSILISGLGLALFFIIGENAQLVLFISGLGLAAISLSAVNNFRHKQATSAGFRMLGVGLITGAGFIEGLLKPLSTSLMNPADAFHFMLALGMASIAFSIRNQSKAWSIQNTLSKSVL